MRTFRLATEHGGADLFLEDCTTGVRIPDVVRVEIAPIEIKDRRAFATIYVHERDPSGKFLYVNDLPMLESMFVEIRIATLWEIR